MFNENAIRPWICASGFIPAQFLPEFWAKLSGSLTFIPKTWSWPIRWRVVGNRGKQNTIAISNSMVNFSIKSLSVGTFASNKKFRELGSSLKIDYCMGEMMRGENTSMQFDCVSSENTFSVFPTFYSDFRKDPRANTEVRTCLHPTLSFP